MVAGFLEHACAWRYAKLFFMVVCVFVASMLCSCFMLRGLCVVVLIC